MSALPPKDPNDVQAMLTWLMHIQGIENPEQTAAKWTARINRNSPPLAETAKIKDEPEA